MRSLLVVIGLMWFASPWVCAQPDEMVDTRDGRRYRIREVNGQWWMMENLQYESVLSLGFTEQQQKEYPEIHARWYHMHELDSVCPEGWRLPQLEDWMGYIKLLNGQYGGKLTIQSDKDQLSITRIGKEVDIFEPGNPLNITRSGIFQGQKFYRPPGSADYWMQDMPDRESGTPNDLYKHVKVSYPGTAHIHFFNAYTNIHSHEHHLDPEDETTLRRFMVRCIRE